MLLIVAELVTNAIRHTDGPCTLHLELHDDHIEIQVTDTSPTHPNPAHPIPTEPAAGDGN
ncbi:ATP-binding protein [Streptomyces sp. MS1.HAVA.3]|uniref:ATP-binding protein n=1 Tax=Streptomyces caledonius TaxID=3134107 RepID=A0ABU8U192_9ACTN